MGTLNISLEKLKVFEFFPRRIHRPHSDSENNTLLRAFSVLVIRKELSKTLSYKLIYKPLHNTESMLQCIHLYFRNNDSISGKPTFKAGKVESQESRSLYHQEEKLMVMTITMFIKSLLCTRYISSNP